MGKAWGAGRIVFVWGALGAAGCASSKPPAPTFPTPVDGCRMVNVGEGLRYDCDGFTVAFHDAPPNAPKGSQGQLDEIVAGLVQVLQPQLQRTGAKVRVDRSEEKMGGKSVLAAKVTLEPPAAGADYAGGSAVVAGRRAIMCSATTPAGMERCRPVMQFLVEDRSR
jgi:hypothetical protein